MTRLYNGDVMRWIQFCAVLGLGACVAPERVDEFDERTVVRSGAANNPGQTVGFLTDRAVYMSQAHGWHYNEIVGGFITQRRNIWNTIEDFHNAEGANIFLNNYLENAGAMVYTPRERGMNSNQALSDDGQGNYTETGMGFVDGAPGFADKAPYVYGVNPFAQGTTRRFPADGGGAATWIPDVPEDGYYAVYVTWDAEPDNTTTAHYRISHPGGVIDRYFDQTVHGSTWQYTETLWLNAGNSLTIELIGDSPEPYTWVSADAVRVGGGMDDVAREGTLTWRPRWESSSILYTQYNGAPTSVYDSFGLGNGQDSGRSRWAEWEHPDGEDAVYLSWHSNTSDGNSRGTETYFAGGGPDAPPNHPEACFSGPAVEGSYTLANLVHTELLATFVDRWDPAWTDHGVDEACFAEVSPSSNDEMPSILIEVAYHDNSEDALLLKHPKFRDDTSRAMYRAIVRYFAQRDGLVPIYLPEPPESVALVHGDDGLLHITWAPGPSGAPLGDAASGYLVSLSPDGRAWDMGTVMAGTEAVILAQPGTTVFARVVATNDGGASFPSEVVGARQSPDGTSPVLVIGAFDRLDRGLLELATVPEEGDIHRFDLHRTNDGTIIAPHGRAISGAGWYFDSASDEAVAFLDLSAYDAVVWATGEESTDDETYAPAQRDQIRTYWEDGGSLWTSGAEIFLDLDSQGDADDIAFASEVLGALLASDAAATSDVSGEGILAGVGAMDFGVAAGGAYPVEAPDVLNSSRTVVARYGGVEVAGVVGDGVATFGFPFETIADPQVRTAVAAALLGELVQSPVPVDIPPDPADQPWVQDPACIGYRDLDGDGYGDPADLSVVCPLPPGFVANLDDCDDNEPLAWTGADEVCDGADNDCDGVADNDDALNAGDWYADVDSDGYGDPNAVSQSCAQPSGTVANPDDCDDSEPLAWTGADEVCDGADNDCDGVVDNDDALDTSEWFADADSDGHGDPSASVTACYAPSGFIDDDTDCDDAEPLAWTDATEVCDDIDNDCDGTVDGPAAVDATTWFADADGDGFSAAEQVTDCDPPSGFGEASDLGDCDDNDETVFPGAAEIDDDGIDQDCDGVDSAGERPTKDEDMETGCGCVTGGAPTPLWLLMLGLLWRRSTSVRSTGLPSRQVAHRSDAEGPSLVLSACETGLGETLNGEGVLGLRRGFNVAGAAQLLMALWAIPDEATRELMGDFYKGWRLGRTSATEALRLAQLRALQRQRKAGVVQPRDWAAFVVSGAQKPRSRLD